MSTTRDDTTRAVELLGPAGLLTVVHDGVDQQRLRQLYERLSAGRGPRAVTLDKEALCTAVVRAALKDDHAMELLARELGRVSAREIGLVGGLQEDEVRSRILALPALQLRRERARVMWAVCMDPRPAAQDVGREMVAALHQAVGQAGEMQRAPNPEVLKQRAVELEQQARAVERRAEGLQSRVARMERDRADALVQLGAREARLRDEVEARAAAERETSLLAARVRELETALNESRTEVSRLREELRVPAQDRALQARYEAVQERLRRTEQERDALQARVQENEAREVRLREEQQVLAHSLVARDQVAQERIRRLRETLRDVRRQRSRPTEEGPARPQPQERVAIHIDVANLGASAMRHLGRRVDFTGLLTTLSQGRAIARAVAYTVESGDPERFHGFCAALRESGFEVRVKRPITRSDGSTKADWDMGLAMDVVEDHERVDTVILCSGDGDFVPLVQLMRRRGKRVEVASFRADTHEELIRSAHAFHPLAVEHTL